MQDRVIGQIVAALAVNLTAAEKASIAQEETRVPLAYDAVLQELEYLRQGSEPETLKAIDFFKYAVELDPNYGRAYAGLAAANWRIVLTLWETTAGAGWENAWDNLKTNLAKAMEHPTALAHAIKAQVLAQQGNYEEAFTEIEQAMALAPNDPDNHIAKAKILNATGRAPEAETAARWAMRLDPQYAPDYLRVLAVAQFHQQRYAEAVQTMQRVVARESDTGEDYALLASAFGHLGQLDKVPAMIEKYNSITVPAFFDPLTVQEMGWWWYGDIYDYDEAYRARLLDGLRKTGVPDGAGTDISRADYLRFMVKTDGEYSVDGTTKIDAKEAHDLLQRGDVRFVDVRATAEYKREHIPGAVSLSLPTVLSRASLLKVVAKDAPVAFYCHGKHCPYSAYASAKALAWGFTKVYYFAGGFPAWEEAGYPIERAPTQ